MKKIILLSIFSICITNTSSFASTSPKDGEKRSKATADRAEKTVAFHCPRAILAQLPSAEREVMQRIGIAESFSHAILTESQVRERVRKACWEYNNRDRITVISPALEKQTADKLIAISVPITPAKI